MIDSYAVVAQTGNGTNDALVFNGDDDDVVVAEDIVAVVWVSFSDVQSSKFVGIVTVVDVVGVIVVVSVAVTIIVIVVVVIVVVIAFSGATTSAFKARAKSESELVSGFEVINSSTEIFRDSAFAEWIASLAEARIGGVS